MIYIISPMVSLGWWHWLKLQAFWQALSDCFREGLVGGASSCVKQSGVPQIANSIGKMMIKHQILELYLFQRTQLSHPHLCDEGRRKPPSIIGIRNWPTHVEMPVPCWKKTQLRTFTVLDPRIRSSSHICGWKRVKTMFPADSYALSSFQGPCNRPMASTWETSSCRALSFKDPRSCRWVVRNWVDFNLQFLAIQ